VAGIVPYLVLLGGSLLSEADLDRAYTALREDRLEDAAQLFESGLASQPGHTARKDFAYTLLKLGNTAAARDQFAAVLALHPSDHDAALEYAYLCHETGRRAESRRVFLRVSQAAAGTARDKAERALSALDQDLAEAIARWTEAARREPDSDSVQEELAKLAEEQGDLAAAERHFSAALLRKPARREFLLDIARVRRQMGLVVESSEALIAATRAPSVRIAELARERLPPASITRETIERSWAFREQPALNRPLHSKTAETVSILELAARSYERGFLDDADRYYRQALDADPGNEQAKLRLGWLANLRGEDRAALRWFDSLRRASDPRIAAEAASAWRRLIDQQARRHVTIWATPLYSTRWHSAFAYGQTQVAFRLSRLPIEPYLSVRFAADFGARNAPLPLSERAITPAAGIRTKPWRGVTSWFEAGGNAGNTRGGDLRGGLAHSKGLGAVIGAEAPGWFYLTENSVNYASRFAHDTLFATRNRAGWGGRQFELGWLFAAGTDTRREYWANYYETGPSLRWRAPRLPANITFFAELVRGANPIVEGNPRGPRYHDARIGVWYAIRR
jgi:tetratricopeptide (TPR) repeat protein